MNTLNAIKISTKADKTVYFNPSNLHVYLQGDNDKNYKNIRKQEFRSRNKILSYEKSLIIRRVTVNVSNTCNMACKYCYASKGNYGKDNQIATADEIIKNITPVITKYHVESIMFFGGEPCLNIDAIIECCIFINELYKLKKIKHAMKYGIVSNLYMSKESLNKIILLKREFNLNVTVSIDGPKYIHDINRVLPDGSGTYDKIKENFFYLKSMKVNPYIQCTYTMEHYKLGITPLKLLLFFEKEFETSNIHLTLESITKESHRFLLPNQYTNDFCELFSYCIKNIYLGKNISVSYLDRIYSALINKAPIDLYCPALICDIAIDIDGKTYPCFMLFKDKKFCIDSSNEQAQKKFRDIATKELSQCKECWNKNLCFGCVVGDYLENNRLEEKSKCDLMKCLTIEVILRLIELSKGFEYESLGTEYRKLDFFNVTKINL